MDVKQDIMYWAGREYMERTKSVNKGPAVPSVQSDRNC